MVRKRFFVGVVLILVSFGLAETPSGGRRTGRMMISARLGS